MKYEKITGKIIKVAFKVHKKLGFGFLENIYHNTMIIELRNEGLKAASEQPVKVYYDDKVIGNYEADIIVEDKIVVELKAA